MTETLLNKLRNMANEPTTSFSAAALMREAAAKIDEAWADCVAMRQFIEYYADDRIPPDQLTRCPETVLGGLRFNAGVILANPSPGQPLLDELDRLRRLEAAVVNREFVWQCPCTDCEDTTDCQDAICAALLTTMKGE